MASFLISTLQEAQRQQNLNNERIRVTSIPIPDDYNDDDGSDNGDAPSGGERTEAGATNNSADLNSFFNSEAVRANHMREAFSHWDSQRRRRQSFLFVTMLFFLLRLWMEALATGDAGMLLLCVLLSTWFIKYQERRRAEEAAMLAHAVERGAGGAGSQSLSLVLGDGTSTSNDGQTSSSGITQFDMNQFGQISARNNMPFQMQLAIAMMQSQQMMHAQINNGMMPESSQQSQQQARGVSSDIQQQWKRFTLKTNEQGEMQVIPKQQPAAQNISRQQQHSTAVNGFSAPLTQFRQNLVSRRSNTTSSSSSQNHIQQRHSSYSSLDDSDDASVLDLEAGPLLDNNANEQADNNIQVDSVTSCSICLSDYEAGDALVQLPCGHLYHDDCVKAWVERSIKCPLCNHTLDGTDEDKPSTT